MRVCDLLIAYVTVLLYVLMYDKSQLIYGFQHDLQTDVGIAIGNVFCGVSDYGFYNPWVYPLFCQHCNKGMAAIMHVVVRQNKVEMVSKGLILRNRRYRQNLLYLVT